MAAYSAVLRGASNIFVVDQVKERLDQAAKIGCMPINFRDGDPVEQIIKKNGGMVDRAVDAVGYQATGSEGEKEQPNIVLDQLIMVTRPTGGLGIPGLYVPSDPGAPDAQSGKGQILISFGKLFEKGLKLGTGQCNVKVSFASRIFNPFRILEFRDPRGFLALNLFWLTSPCRRTTDTYVTSSSPVVLSPASW